MDASLSRRYRDPQPIHAGPDVRLEVAHDLVSDRAVWLLHAEGLQPRDAAVSLLLRQRVFGAAELLRWPSFEIEDAGEETLCTARATPVSTEPWIAAYERADSGPREAMRTRLESALAELLDLRLPLGSIDPVALVATPDGPRLLPSTWLVPPSVPDGMSAVDWSTEGPKRAVGEIVRFLARRGGPRMTVPPEPVPPLVPADLADVLDAMSGGEALHLTGPCRSGEGLPGMVDDGRGEALAAWGASRGLTVIRATPDHRVQVPAADPARPALVLVDGAERYADVVQTLDRLVRARWMDGRERLVVLSPGEELDGVFGLFLQARYGSGLRVHDWPGAPSREALRASGTARFVLDALAVLGCFVPLALLLRLARLDAAGLAVTLEELWREGEVRIVSGHHVSEPRRQTSVALRRSRRVDPARAGELRGLIAHDLRHTGGRDAGAAWWRARVASGGADPADGVRLLREAARRAEDAELPLLALSALDRILDLDTDVTADDVIRRARLRSEADQRTGDVEAAQQGLSDALAWIERMPDAVDPSAWAELVFRAVQLDFHRSDFVAAERRLEDLLARVRNDLPAEPRALANAELAWAQLHRGRTREAVRTAELALRRLDPLEHGALVARLHNLVGFALYNQSEYPESIAHYERALRLREQLGDDLGVARTQNNMALSFMALGQTAEAESALLESLRRKRSVGDDLSIAASLINLGCVRIESEDLDGTEDVAGQALEIARLRNHPETEAEALGLFGDVALARGDPLRALDCFQRNLALCEANGHDTERLLTLRRLGAVLLQLDRDDEAAESLERARTLLDTQPSRFEGAKVDMLEAELLVRAGELDLAVESLASAIRGFSTSGRHRDQIRASIRRAELEAERGRLERVRASVAEIHELIARFDVHRPPPGLGRLETLIRDDETRVRPLTPEASMALLLESLGQTGCGLSGAGRHAAGLRTALGAERLFWVDPAGDASVAEARGWNPSDASPRVLRASVGDDSFERRDGCDVYGVPGGGHLIIERSAGLRAHERDLVRGVVRVWQTVDALRSTDAPTVSPAEAVHAATPDGDFGLIGRSEGMRRVVQWIHRVAHTDLAVLVLGENGSGKELVAKALHDAGLRRDGPFVAINCASIPASLLESELFGHERGAFTSAHAQRVGRFEQARGGTLFLDEIGEMPPDMQAKLLRVLQERTFTRVGGSEQLSSDARIVAATNRDLRTEVERGHFRVDLYYRLNVVTIEIPPLRARLGDIEPLVRHFVARDAAAYRGGPVEVDSDVIEHLRHYHWPGNVRELENAVRNALVFGQGTSLRPEDFPLGSSPGAATDGTLETAIEAIAADERWSADRPILPRIELLLVHEVVRRVGNKTRAAKLLGITKPTLYDRLRRYEALFGPVRADER